MWWPTGVGIGTTYVCYLHNQISIKCHVCLWHECSCLTKEVWWVQGTHKNCVKVNYRITCYVLSQWHYLQDHSPRVSTSRDGAPWLQLKVTWRYWIGFRCTVRSWTGGVAIIPINKHYQTKCQLQYQDMSLVVTSNLKKYSCEKQVIALQDWKLVCNVILRHVEILHTGLVSNGRPQQSRFLLLLTNTGGCRMLILLL
jgi:hypothetical protein